MRLVPALTCAVLAALMGIYAFTSANIAEALIAAAMSALLITLCVGYLLEKPARTIFTQRRRWL